MPAAAHQTRLSASSIAKLQLSTPPWPATPSGNEENKETDVIARQKRALGMIGLSKQQAARLTAIAVDTKPLRCRRYSHSDHNPALARPLPPLRRKSLSYVADGENRHMFDISSSIPHQHTYDRRAIKFRVADSPRRKSVPDARKEPGRSILKDSADALSDGVWSASSSELEDDADIDSTPRAPRSPSRLHSFLDEEARSSVALSDSPPAVVVSQAPDPHPSGLGLKKLLRAVVSMARAALDMLIM
ncbi:hypothetical protein J8273_7262 [Carpediemonas membranifera]|uniref:Uncharacterized protein n=1 Tax=Carpediemonas membranifera TaxID=201153 RepID=A0A8J6AQG0_9EUKA|nr:hypothetical protein J8273_7262 [Carpediemonas membranifera]|eukprot:KAG9390988.1 hypothetical protein J8273_7262 [Carpediemonas membranifera]